MTGRRARTLCVDVGNTAVKFGIAGGSDCRLLWRGGTSTFRRRVTVPQAVRSLLGGNDVTGVAVSSVVPALDRALRGAIAAAGGRDVLFVSHRSRLPFRLDVRSPGELGADRLCAAAGAISPRTRSAIVVDMGSAITVDLVHERRYKGGLILAGPALSLRALGEFAERLPQMDYTRARVGRPRLFGGTRAAMVLGATIGAVGAARAAVTALESYVGRRLPVVVSGGAADDVADRLPARWRLRPYAVFEGLHRIWLLNR